MSGADAMGPMTPAMLRALQTPETPRSRAEAAKAFEAIMLRQLVRAMRPSGGSLGGQGSQLVDHLVESSLADHLAAAGGIGLADLMALQIGGAEPDDVPRAPEPPGADAGGPAIAAPEPPRDRGANLSRLPPQDDPWLDAPDAADLLLRQLAGDAVHNRFKNSAPSTVEEEDGPERTERRR